MATAHRLRMEVSCLHPVRAPRQPQQQQRGGAGGGLGVCDCVCVCMCSCLHEALATIVLAPDESCAGQLGAAGAQVRLRTSDALRNERLFLGRALGLHAPLEARTRARPLVALFRLFRALSLGRLCALGRPVGNLRRLLFRKRAPACRRRRLWPHRPETTIVDYHCHWPSMRAAAQSLPRPPDARQMSRPSWPVRPKTSSG